VWLVIGLGLLASGLAPTRAAESLLLRLDLEAGDTHRFAMSLDQRMKIEVGAMGTQNNENSMSLDYTFRVTDVAEDGTMTIEGVYERIRAELRTMGNEIAFDTAADAASDEDNPLSMLRDLVGKTLVFKVSPLGRVLEVEGFEELFEEMRARVGQDPATSGAADLIESSFDEDSLKTMCQQSLIVFSEDAVGVGETWESNVETANPAMGPIDTRATFELRGPATRNEKECVELGMSMTMSFGDEMPLLTQLRDSFAQQGMEIDLDMEMDQLAGNGTIWVDPDTGLIVDSDITQTMNATFTMTMGTGPEAVVLTMPMNLEQKIGVRSLD
jgi:hypothetical protein